MYINSNLYCRSLLFFLWDGTTVAVPLNGTCLSDVSISFYTSQIMAVSCVETPICITNAPMEPLLCSYGIVSSEYFIHSFSCSPDHGGFI
jgi:hypothetical protein